MHPTSDIESILDSFCKNKITQAMAVDARYAQLWQEIRRYLLAGGKRMRPQLVILAYKAYGGTSERDIVPIAAAWELLHASLLVHDDIIDRDFIRHGQPNIAGRYQSIYGELDAGDISHYASTAALLGGDLLLTGAYELIMSASVTNDAKLRAQSYVNNALFAVAGGELIDTDAALYPIDHSDPRSVAIHKTASYSLQLPLECGAELAGAPAAELHKLHDTMLHAGVAYQLRDDLLGVFGDSNVTGKSNRSDILEKKRTFLIQQTLQNLAAPQALRLKELFSPKHTVTDAEAEEIVELITASDAKKHVEHLMNLEIEQTIKGITTLEIDERQKEAFSTIITQLTSRTR